MLMIPALLLANFVFTLVTLSRGLVCGMRVPNFYCKSCLRTLFRVADCIVLPLVTVAIPESLLEPQFAQATCLALLFAAARLWPGTPVRPVLLIEYGVLETLRSSQKKCVACARRAPCGPSATEACLHSSQSSHRAFIANINDVSMRHGVSRTLHHSSYIPAIRQWFAAKFMSTAIVSDVARPGGEPLCPSCKGGEGSKSKATAGGDGNLKEYRYVCMCRLSVFFFFFSRPYQFFGRCSYASSGRLVTALGRQLGWVPYFDGFVGVFTILFGGWLAKFWSVLYDDDGKPRKGAAAEEAVRIVVAEFMCR